MEKKNHYSAIILLTVVLAASTVFAFVNNMPTSAPDAAAQSSEDGDAVCTSGLCCNTFSVSFVDGNISCDGKTGWQMIVEQVANIN
jgi:hypothetical protein